MVSKWNLNNASYSNAVANYTNLSGNLKKAYGKKKRSGRSAGKDDVTRFIKETRRCLVCARPKEQARVVGEEASPRQISQEVKKSRSKVVNSRKSRYASGRVQLRFENFSETESRLLGSYIYVKLRLLVLISNRTSVNIHEEVRTYSYT